MKHGNSIRKFNRKRNQRRALMNSLARSLILKEKIKTTEAKAKSLKPVVEKMISQGKKQTLAARRILVPKIGNEGAKKVVDILSPRYRERQGGFARIIKLPSRKSDSSKMAVIEFV